MGGLVEHRVQVTLHVEVAGDEGTGEAQFVGTQHDPGQRPGVAHDDGGDGVGRSGPAPVVGPHRDAVRSTDALR